MTIAPLTAFHRRLAIADGCVVLRFDIERSRHRDCKPDADTPIGVAHQAPALATWPVSIPPQPCRPFNSP